MTILVSSNCLECGSSRSSCREEVQRKINVKSYAEKHKSANVEQKKNPHRTVAYTCEG